MKKTIILMAILCLLSGCTPAEPAADIAATTLPVYEFTQRLCDGTGLQVTRLVTESVSCLHDYSLNVRQVRAVEEADLIVMNGAGLEDFMDELLTGLDIIDSSEGIDLIECGTHHEHEHEHDHHSHSHETDSHIWLSPELAKQMASNICAGLIHRYPEHKDLFTQNLTTLLEDLDALQSYGEEQLRNLECREIITFHDGFTYLAESFGIHILEAVEEESGAEASAAELKELIILVREHQLPAIFTEQNGSVSAARIISAETGVKTFSLDMAMSGDSWFEAMYRNIDTLKEALE